LAEWEALKYQAKYTGRNWFLTGWHWRMLGIQAVPLTSPKNNPMLLSVLFCINFFLAAPAPLPPDAVPASIYDFKVDGLSGGAIDFKAFKGKKILIVNTASECGYTPQYAGLDSLYRLYGNKLVVVGFPANDFGQQEPGSNEQIAAFCQKNYGVSFPMAAKISVKGADMAPIYQWLTQKRYNGFKDSEVRWNFQKYLIDEQGQLVAVFPSKTSPLSAELVEAVKK
jgi:glutathione peroxidase